MRGILCGQPASGIFFLDGFKMNAVRDEACVRQKMTVFLTLFRVDECLHLAGLFAQNRCLGARQVPKEVGMTHRSLQQSDAMFVCPPNGGQIRRLRHFPGQQKFECKCMCHPCMCP